MKKIKLLTGTGRSGLFGAAMAFMAIAFGFSSCRPEFDLDKRFPSELGTSIYETLSEGFDNRTFKCFVAIIDSLDYKKVLDKTGSKTLFVADDDAFAKFLKKCPLAGNREIKFADLTKAQMKQIFYGSMLNNVYQVAALSNTEGPTIGDCMRRLTSAGIYDSVRIMLPGEMPKTKYWNRFNDPSRSSGIVVLEDGTEKPMIIFSDKFMQSRGITRDDYDFLFNLGNYGDGTKNKSQYGEATVNGVRIIQENKKCFNGFIHVMEDVVYLLPSMAEYLAMSDPNDVPSKTTIIYSSILDRFSAPYYVYRVGASGMFPVTGLTTSQSQLSSIRDLISRKVLKNTPALSAALSTDSVYTKLYFSKWNQSKPETKENYLRVDPFGDSIRESSLLKFDPGWNSYFVSSTSDDNIALQQNMGVMIVPTDEAMIKWWVSTEGGGYEMRQKYGKDKTKSADPSAWSAQEVAEDMDSVDLNVIVKLVNNNMLSSLVSSVPSKFKDVLNDAQDRLFEDVEQAKKDIQSVAMCCNGAIYFSNYIPVPTSYKSVAYPAIVNERLKVMDWAIEDEEMSFTYYLNAMRITYSLFLPQVSSDPRFEDKVVWIDPASFAIKKYNTPGSESKSLIAIAFGFDDIGKNVYADLYEYDEVNDVYGDKQNTSPIKNEDFLRNRLEDMLNYHIVITNTSKDKRGVEANVVNPNKYAFYRTKGGGAIRFKVGGVDPVTQYTDMEVDGGWQIETGQKVNIVPGGRYDMWERSKGNGITYIIDKPLMTSRKSVYDILSDSDNYPKFKLFFKLMDKAGLFENTSNKSDIGSSYCVSSFSTFNYTVYVPSSDTIQALMDSHVLYSYEDLDDMDKKWKDIRHEIEDEYVNVDSAWRDTMIYLSRSLRKAAPEEANTHADSVFDYKNFTTHQRDVLVNFVKYHIQDNSIYVNGEFNRDETEYQTAYMRASDKRYVKVTVKEDNDNNNLSIYDALYDKDHPNKHPVRHVVTDDEKYYNIMCREYEFKEGFGSNAKAVGAVTDVTKTKLETSSYAVIHLIDAPLFNGEF